MFNPPPTGAASAGAAPVGGGETKSRDDDYESPGNSPDRITFLKQVEILCQNQKEVFPRVREYIDYFQNMVKEEREKLIAMQNS